jgi:hypothetical protein
MRRGVVQTDCGNSQLEGDVAMCSARWSIASKASAVRAALLILSLSIGSNAARAGSVTPVKSSFALTALAVAPKPSAPGVWDTDSQSQGSTLNALSVAVSAKATYAPFNQTLLVTANGSATWTSSSTGEVSYTNVGWTNNIGNGQTSLSTNTGWIYTFTSNVTGSFDIEYSVTAHGTSTTKPDPLFGLIGFYLYEGPGLKPPPYFFNTGLNRSGSVSLALDAGQTYTVQIKLYSNIGGIIGNTKAHMAGTFTFSVQPYSVPEPSSLCMVIISSIVGAIVLFLKNPR